jgi:hypothetical protein
MENDMTKLKVHDSGTAELVVAGKTLSQWEGEWKPVKGGFSVPHPELRHVVGLFRAVSRDGEVQFIGAGTEHANGGLRKRVADFRRSSASARDHYGGEYIHDHLDDLELEVLVAGSERQAGEAAKALKPICSRSIRLPRTCEPSASKAWCGRKREPLGLNQSSRRWA